jgi:hypothetical protein
MKNKPSYQPGDVFDVPGIGKLILFQNWKDKSATLPTIENFVFTRALSFVVKRNEKK